MDFVDKYITNISKEDVKYACEYKVHASYVFLGIIITWILSIVSTILTTLFLGSVFITIVNVARNTRRGTDELNITLSKLNDSSSDEESDHDDDSVDPINSLSASVLNDADETVMQRDELENKKVN